MKEEKIEIKDKILFVPVSAQPPTFGTVLSIMYAYDSYDKIIICLHDNPILIKTNVLIKMFSIIFRPPKFEIITRNEDFSMITDIPNDLPKYDFIGTLSDRIYINLSTKGLPCALLPRSLGFDELFHRVAFKKSTELETLRLRMTLVNINNAKEKASEPPDEEGEE